MVDCRPPILFEYLNYEQLYTIQKYSTLLEAGIGGIKINSLSEILEKVKKIRTR